MTNAVYVYDLTIPQEGTDKDELETYFNVICSKWTYQLEKGEETGFLHYQCRVSLVKKVRITGAIKLFEKYKAHVSITFAKNMGNDFYVMKEDTRVDGP